MVLILNEDQSFMANDTSIEYTYETFMALVNAIIPRTPNLAELYGDIMFYGALDFYTDEYLVMMLNHYFIPLYNITANLLNVASEEFIRLSEGSINDRFFSDEYPLFSQLSSEEIFLITYQLVDYAAGNDQVNLQDYPGILTILTSLNRYTLLGYYSEWYGYGSTRMNTPNQRFLQYFPPSWEQVEYPGPSLSYISYVREYYAQKES